MKGNGLVAEEIALKQDCAALSGGQAYRAKDLGGDNLVDKRSKPLRIIPKLDNVEITIIGLNQPSLRAAMHCPD
jgi:hypothetical protein